MLGRCRGCGRVWKREWGKCGGCVEVGESVLGCGEMWGSQHTLLHLSPHSPDTSSHTHLTPLPRIPHSPDTSLDTFLHSPPHTLSHFSSSLTPFLHLHNTFPHSLPILPHNPHVSSNTSLCSPYFIIYSMPKFLTFLIYCQISLTIKYTRNSL